jgi:hypothetical protein
VLRDLTAASCEGFLESGVGVVGVSGGRLIGSTNLFVCIYNNKHNQERMKKK